MKFAARNEIAVPKCAAWMIIGRHWFTRRIQRQAENVENILNIALQIVEIERTLLFVNIFRSKGSRGREDEAAAFSGSSVNFAQLVELQIPSPSVCVPLNRAQHRRYQRRP